ncbi:hypothetical protein TNCV_2067991 [Trichonephila clavipes]|uniref:Uncharacterized protein n=1 Tax=Trichonephila clavipes TaxID=2585209 RepID=A0A8X6W2X7_TRICX|nr:hypothetical protein TNCV_2067991 [Trichonephila clavipes]
MPLKTCHVEEVVHFKSVDVQSLSIGLKESQSPNRTLPLSFYRILYPIHQNLFSQFITQNSNTRNGTIGIGSTRIAAPIRHNVTGRAHNQRSISAPSLSKINTRTKDRERERERKENPKWNIPADPITVRTSKEKKGNKLTGNEALKAHLKLARTNERNVN